MEFTILNNKGKEAGKVEFNEALLQNKASKAVLHDVVVAHLANQRQGTHFTKTRAEVSGGGIKPWRQKHTGRARSGSIRSPLWRHGGIIFGPRPRDYRQDVPKKKKHLAFRMALQGLIQSERLQVVEPVTVSEPKTKLVSGIYKKWNAPTDSLFVLDKIDPLFARAAKNIAGVQVTTVDSLNTYDCMAARKIFITPTALEQLTARIGKGLEE